MKILYLPNAYSQQRQHEKKRKIYPIRMAMEAEYYYKGGHLIVWDNPDYQDYDLLITEPEGLPFLDLPWPNRYRTKFWEYQDNGNFKHKPATYILSASGCWWSKCRFCMERGHKYEVRDVLDVIREINHCQRIGFREVFDDSGTFPTGEWLQQFCHFMKKNNMIISCNMRFDKLTKGEYKMMKNVGFRMLLYGLESANQKTLDKMNKGIDIKHAIEELKMVSSLGLEAHIAFMVSYPWETLEEELNTIELVHWLLKKGYAKTAQCSVYTPLNEKVWRERAYLTKKLFDVAKYPEFWFNQIKNIRNIDDLKYLWTKIKNGLKRGR